MRDTLDRTSPDGALIAGWRDGLDIVNLRGDPGDAGFVRAASEALGLALPGPGCTAWREPLRVVWAGPDDWFVIRSARQEGALAPHLEPRLEPHLEPHLGAALAGMHHAVTDVGAGYALLHLAGRPVRELLAQGCPLDLHPRVFGSGAAAGSHFFKASVWLWQVDEAPQYELLVRRSFQGYVQLMLERCTAECGLYTRRFS